MNFKILKKIYHNQNIQKKKYFNNLFQLYLKFQKMIYTEETKFFTFNYIYVNFISFKFQTFESSQEISLDK